VPLPSGSMQSRNQNGVDRDIRITYTLTASEGNNKCRDNSDSMSVDTIAISIRLPIGKTLESYALFDLRKMNPEFDSIQKRTPLFAIAIH